MLRSIVTFKILQIIKGVIQEFCSKPLRIITHEEGQMRVAKEKLKKSMYETLHIDSTSGFFDKLDDSNICYSAACLRGKLLYTFIFL